MSTTMSRSPYWPHATGFVPRLVIVVAAIATVFLVIGSSLLVALANFNMTGTTHEVYLGITLLVAFIAGILILLWGNGINYRIRERKSELWQWNVPVDSTGRWVSPRNVQRILFVLHRAGKKGELGDGEIRLITRLHWIYLIRRAGIPLILAVTSWICLVSLTGPTVAIHTWDLNGTRSTHNFGAVFSGFFFVTFIVMVALTVFGILAWSRHFLVVTDFSFKTVWVYPVWLPWLRNNVRPLEGKDIRNVYKVDSHLGGLLGYGHVDVSTFLQEDEDRYFKVNWVPRHHIVRDVIDNMRPERAEGLQ